MEEHFGQNYDSLNFIKNNKLFMILSIIALLFMVGTISFLVIELSDAPISERYKNFKMEKHYEHN